MPRFNQAPRRQPLKHVGEKPPCKMKDQALLDEHAALNNFLDGRITNRSVSEQDLNAMGCRRVALNDEIEKRRLLRLRSTNHPARKPANGQR